MTTKAQAVEAVFAAEAALNEARRELAEIERRERESYAARMLAVLTPAVIDALAPEHERTSCSDEDLANATSHNGRAPRCLRCALVQAHRHHYWPTDLKLEIRALQLPQI